MREKTGFNKMRGWGEAKDEMKCGRITRNAGDLAGLQMFNHLLFIISEKIFDILN